MKAAGFTIVELIVTLLVVTIISVKLLPLMGAQSISVSSLAEQLAADIRYVQSLSMTQGARYCITGLSAGSTGYAFATGNNCATAVNYPATGTAAGPTFSSGASITAVVPALANSYLAFNGQGIPYTTNPVPAVSPTALAAKTVITLTQGSGTMTVSVNPDTGLVTVP